MERKELSGTQKALAELERYRVIADYYLENPLSALEEKNRKKLREIRGYIFSEGKNLNSRIFYEKSSPFGGFKIASTSSKAIFSLKSGSYEFE